MRKNQRQNEQQDAESQQRSAEGAAAWVQGCSRPTRVKRERHRRTRSRLLFSCHRGTFRAVCKQHHELLPVERTQARFGQHGLCERFGVTHCPTTVILERLCIRSEARFR